MKATILTLILAFIITTSVSAQDYETGIGFRGGLSNGITVKHFISKTSALEGILSSRWQGFNITGLYEIHNWSFDTPRLNWYYGFGGHIGFWNGYENHPWFKETGSYSVIGIDGIIGIEYNIETIPINISLDWKPGINIIGYSGFWGDELAFSVRFIF
ncbi:MAG: hypothetical protein HN778_08855 [Prolixibacteraceae bacterium]|jgi:hypothetical protein|nr:hypothetical protein [Prolixibacteraceae bacterium]MBT6766636.1 hypothetical protein [Prolixibacteraceae bacterium]MBT6997618.1 hypothetical protein [Prolixibacteraceae bacterium]MBT7394925.1 hypothetical protein [Prolixibacteraceae bacterium]